MNATTPAHPQRTIRVALGERSYDIVIGPGLVDEVGPRIAALLPGARAAIVTDENVARLHLERLTLSLDAAGVEHRAIVLPAGETTKSYAGLTRVVEAIIEGRFERGDAVLAFGGGVIGDLAGFASAVVRRGMRFVQMPTSLLAQVDSSVGGKTGINSPQGKNLVGAFHQPTLVLADTALLDTLPPREFAAGYAEIVKYGLIDRPDFFEWLETNREDIFAGTDALIDAIAISCEAKAAVVAADETEQDSRALLNLGHTFGHALEKTVRYEASRLVHGEGVAIGICLAHRFCAARGLAPEEDARRVEAHFAAAGLPTRIQHIAGETPPIADLMDAIAQDKKVTRSALTFILTHGIGKAFIARNVDPADVGDFLAEELLP
ncbi:3-dehydroquinate synthase [Fulvimarina sp. 2208YS6-2-32]|uniref:3-dehydroquinate synthase n=1 Tax=Fulvimarina uroteuthidis TaxID=3098149 RepID=A0ABU5HXG6_9HYPH|nr:3-dehydroquinate synthase [Fulvimarina sp. 2208YS6-2-32]MDY8107834.1 3-dehydroquinate synthase [Fulvimarina sp. 2208YS6-2-32]